MDLKRIKSICTVLFFFLFTQSSYAADNNPINYIGIEQGLSNNSVRAIYQDHHGFMWFGTYDGLNRYDGYEFTVFRNRLNDSNSLPHNYIYAIEEDQHNNLWVGTGQGIGIYNMLTSKWQACYYLSYPTKRKEKLLANVNAIKTDAAGNVFIGTNSWGLIIQYNGAAIGTQLPVEKDNTSDAGYNVRSITIDKKGHLWLFIQDLGLCRYNYQNKKIELVSAAIKTANRLKADGQDNLWIGTDNGLYQYDLRTNQIKRKYTEPANELTSNRVASLDVDDKGLIWIGTEGGGIDVLNPLTQTFTYLLPEQIKQSLTSESVFAIYEDKESRKWIGTLKGGINVIDSWHNPFQTYSHDRLQQNGLVYNFVSSFYEDANQNLWIGTDGGGMSIWNRKQNSFTNFKHDAAQPNSLSNNLVTSIAQDDQNNYWIATYGGGVNKWNKKGNSFQFYSCYNKEKGIENKNVWILYQDHLKNFWATTFGRGTLYRFNKITNSFEVFDQSLIDPIALTEDRQGNLWMGNSHQLIQLDRQNKKHLIYEIGKPVRAIYEDSKHHFWIGTEGGGLILFNRQLGKIERRYSEQDGLCNNSVLNILEDDKQNLWLSTFNGLSRLDDKRTSFKNYYQSDGLQSNQFLYNAALRLHSGELVFGGIKGFTIFHPDSLQSHIDYPPVFITSMRINNHPLSSDNDYVSKTTGDQIAALKIPFNEAVLTIDFAALEYSAPAKITYAYYLQGWDKDWNYSGNIRTANYSHLKEGTYLLRIKSTNPEGTWNKKELTLRITVLPPWYRSWWAYLMYLAIAVVLVYLYLRYRTRQTKLEYEIKLAKLNAEKEREVNEKRLSFFTNISHEFRTPLTLIINPIKDLLKAGERNNEHNELNIIYQNARRMLSLADQLLLFQRADTEADQLHLVKLNFYQLCKGVYLSFLNQAKKRKLDYQFKAQNEQLELYCDRQKMEIILYNLLSNALKFTQEGGSVVFELKENMENIEVVIADNGPGIPASIGNKLFERFYRVEHTDAPKPGFGIGLYLVKHFVEKQKGTISYDSQLGKGTTFNLLLKKGKEHFGEEPIQETETKTFPLEEVEEVPKEEIKTINLDELIGTRKAILVVDDNEEIRQYMISLFKDNYKVYEAKSGDEGLKLTEQYLPDLVISDIMMQNGTGIDLCRSIKENSSLNYIPVILLTGLSSAEIKLQGIEYGADDYITKPFEKDLLIARVESLLKSRNQLQEYFYNEITLKHSNLKISSEYKEFLEKCIAIVEAHLDDEQFSVKHLSQEIGMSHSNLYRKVKSISGQSVNGFIRFIRLRKAAELMLQSRCNVNEAAFQVGINDIKYFRKQFQILFGMNPSEYIKKYRAAFDKTYSLNEKVIKTKE